MSTNHLPRYFNPTNDVAFKKLFQDQAKLMDLLNSILKLQEGHKIIELTYLPCEMSPLYMGGRQSIFDLKVKDQKGYSYIIEMQRKREKSYLNRIQFYGSSTFVSQIDQAMKYEDLLPVVVISILGTKIFTPDVPYISYHRCLEDTTKQQFLFATTYVFVELGKFDGDTIQNDADAWLHLFKCAATEDSPPEEIHNPNIIGAYAELEKYKWTKDEYDAYIRSSLAAEGEEDRLTEGLEEKYEEGREAGREEGRHKEKLETARRFYTLGLSDKIIIEGTGISKQELQKIKK